MTNAVGEIDMSNQTEGKFARRATWYIDPALLERRSHVEVDDSGIHWRVTQTTNSETGDLIGLSHQALTEEEVNEYYRRKKKTPRVVVWLVNLFKKRAS